MTFPTFYSGATLTRGSSIRKEIPLPINLFLEDYQIQVSPVPELGQDIVDIGLTVGPDKVWNLLLQSNADKSIKNETGHTPLDIEEAVYEKKEAAKKEIISFLIANESIILLHLNLLSN